MHAMDHLTEHNYTSLRKSERDQDAVYETLQFKPAAIRRGVSSERNVYVPLSACLGLLCVAAVAAIVYFCVRHTAVRNQLENSLHNLSQNTDLLESSLNKLWHEKGQLQIINNNLTKETNRLQKIISKYDKDCCPENWWKFSTSCYFVSASEKMWDESRTFCREKGGDLVIINSKEEQKYLNDNMKGDVKEIWIGLSDTELEGVWKWVDGTPLTESLRLWRVGEPNNSEGNENCVVFVRSTATNPQPFTKGVHPTLLVWNDVPCSRSMPFICEQKRL